MTKDRHSKVWVSCETCGNPFMARKERIEKGLGRFCSKNCFDIEQRKRVKDVWGRKDLAKKYKIGNSYTARWYDENGKVKSTPYPRWWWEMNVGEIPQGMIVLLKDNNPLNIDPNNFELGRKSDALKKGNQTRKKDPAAWDGYIEKLRVKQTGFKHTPESKAKISAVHKGKKLSPEHLLAISNNSIKLWNEGFFDKIHKGEHNKHWRGGVSKEYPKEFSQQLKDFIKTRDNYQCQICSKSLWKSKNAQVHHRDGRREHNDQNNLLLLCSSCHTKVHSTSMQSPPIMALRSELHWNMHEVET